MAELTNHIRRVTIDFQFNGKTDGFTFQQEVRDWFDEFVAALDDEFKVLSVDERVIQIELLELEVSLDGRDWREQASQKIIRQLKDRLRLMRAGEISAPAVKETTATQQFGQCFLHYLQFGYLPWPWSGLNTVQWHDTLTQLKLNISPQFRIELILLLLRSTTALQRFIQLIPTELALQLTANESSDFTVRQEELRHDITELIKRNVFTRDPFVKYLLYRALLSGYAGDRDVSEIEQELVTTLTQKFSDHVDIKTRFDKITFQSSAFIVLKNAILKAVDFPKTQKAQPGLRKKIGHINEELLPEKEPAEEGTSKESIFIANAGLVIVAPFLPGLFERLGLATSEIIAYDAKAVGLTHFLAAGNDTIQEYELPLAKILCGIPVQKPVDVSNFRATKKMRAEVENVLSSVIEHWSILGSTSASGLQESFLKRNGMLHFDGNHWVLQVEQQPYDMLLQHLPWTISMIKLPWMRYMLKTDWVY